MAELVKHDKVEASKVMGNSSSVPVSMRWAGSFTLKKPRDYGRAQE
jgi:hypothetical protein